MDLLTYALTRKYSSSSSEVVDSVITIGDNGN